jgi:hypothetical protein
MANETSAAVNAELAYFSVAVAVLKAKVSNQEASLKKLEVKVERYNAVMAEDNEKLNAMVAMLKAKQATQRAMLEELEVKLANFNTAQVGSNAPPANTELAELKAKLAALNAGAGDPVRQEENAEPGDSLKLKMDAPEDEDEDLLEIDIFTGKVKRGTEPALEENAEPGDALKHNMDALEDLDEDLFEIDIFTGKVKRRTEPSLVRHDAADVAGAELEEAPENNTAAPGGR